MDYSSILELVMLPTGEIALKRVDSDEEPLLTIQFSEESLEALGESKMMVVKAMVEAGIEAFTDMSSIPPEDDDVPPMLH